MIALFDYGLIQEKYGFINVHSYIISQSDSEGNEGK